MSRCSYEAAGPQLLSVNVPPPPSLNAYRLQADSKRPLERVLGYAAAAIDYPTSFNSVGELVLWSVQHELVTRTTEFRNLLVAADVRLSASEERHRSEKYAAEQERKAFERRIEAIHKQLALLRDEAASQQQRSAELLRDLNNTKQDLVDTERRRKLLQKQNNELLTKVADLEVQASLAEDSNRRIRHVGAIFTFLQRHQVSKIEIPGSVCPQNHSGHDTGFWKRIYSKVLVELRSRRIDTAGSKNNNFKPLSKGHEPEHEPVFSPTPSHNDKSNSKSGCHEQNSSSNGKIELFRNSIPQYSNTAALNDIADKHLQKKSPSKHRLNTESADIDGSGSAASSARTQLSSWDLKTPLPMLVPSQKYTAVRLRSADQAARPELTRDPALSNSFNGTKSQDVTDERGKQRERLFDRFERRIERCYPRERRGGYQVSPDVTTIAEIPSLSNRFARSTMEPSTIERISGSERATVRHQRERFSLPRFSEEHLVTWKKRQNLSGRQHAPSPLRRRNEFLESTGPLKTYPRENIVVSPADFLARTVELPGRAGRRQMRYSQPPLSYMVMTPHRRESPSRSNLSRALNSSASTLHQFQERDVRPDRCEGMLTKLALYKSPSFHSGTAASFLTKCTEKSNVAAGTRVGGKASSERNPLSTALAALRSVDHVWGLTSGASRSSNNGLKRNNV